MRKSMSYLEDQVDRGASVWVNPADKRKGIIARDMLNFGPRLCYPPSPECTNEMDGWLEIPGVIFRGPRAPMIVEPRADCAMLA